MKNKLSYIWMMAIVAIAIIYGCNKDDILKDRQNIAAVPLKMIVKNDVITSGDSLAIVFSVEPEGTVANKDIEINLSVKDDSKNDASDYFLGFTKLITFPRGEKTLIKKYQLSKLQMSKMNVQLSALSEASQIAENTIPLTISNSDLCDIISFNIGESIGIINKEEKTVFVPVKWGSDLTSLSPVLEVSLDATYSPEGSLDFSSPVVYTITAQDGVTQKEYTVTVEYAKNDEAIIESFMLGNYPGVINQDNYTINVNVPVGTNTDELRSSLNLAYGATYQSNGNIFTVTSEDKENTQDYNLNVIEKTVAPQMSFVEAGTFTMGAGGVAPTFESTISRDMYVGIYEVTYGQYKELLGSTRASVQSWRWLPGGPDMPMACLSWYDACDFSNQLSVAHGLQPYYDITDIATDNRGRIVSASVTINDSDGKGYRLLTEAEYEFAARGGNESKGYTFSGGNESTEVAWVRSNITKVYNPYGDPHPVGLKKPNELGIYDMTGNIKEWVWDWFSEERPLIPTTDPMGPNSGTHKITRGGSYWSSDNAGELKVWDRGKPFAPHPNHYEVGFRIVRNK
ncbi:DUF5018 domain-containing protein [Puteibacter caeruleilacunae]|nr:DUF5018 domain-containing protein [Puteibacter caeruleilacunae]